MNLPMVAVVTRIAPRPPHRSRRALLMHRAPPSGSGVEAMQRLRMTPTGHHSSARPPKRASESLRLMRLIGERSRRETLIAPFHIEGILCL
jgi:hypothetical protein